MYVVAASMHVSSTARRRAGRARTSDQLVPSMSPLLSAVVRSPVDLLQGQRLQLRQNVQVQTRP